MPINKLDLFSDHRNSSITELKVPMGSIPVVDIYNNVTFLGLDLDTIERNSFFQQVYERIDVAYVRVISKEKIISVKTIYAFDRLLTKYMFLELFPKIEEIDSELDFEAFIKNLSCLYLEWNPAKDTYYSLILDGIRITKSGLKLVPKQRLPAMNNQTHAVLRSTILADLSHIFSLIQNGEVESYCIGNSAWEPSFKLDLPKEMNFLFTDIDYSILNYYVSVFHLFLNNYEKLDNLLMITGKYDSSPVINLLYTAIKSRKIYFIDSCLSL